MNPVAHFEKLLASGQDNALLRYSLGNAYFNDDKPSEAIPHLAQALAYDPGYSAAWKAYGKALTATGQIDQARKAYERGIEAAENKGDKQAAKEMQVFLRRLQKKADE
ncbi:MAG: tetratricopeptide repeat protein [Gammaproteobacteria bacterium]|nr:tetratricopeptide repeat protein [Gammaproteobacteria bacterium]